LIDLIDDEMTRITAKLVAMGIRNGRGKKRLRNEDEVGTVENALLICHVSI